MHNDTQAVYFPGLNGIRAWAASLVIFMHFNQYSFLFGLSRFYPDSELADIAVTVFFVLSGYLITYLLLSEKIQYDTVSIKQFYIRRILRIWPLYYTILLLSVLLYILLPVADTEIGIVTPILLFAFFIPNYAYIAGFTIIPITPLWSVGVEEQFYLMWPWLFRGARSMTRVRNALVIFLFGFLTIKLGLRLFENGFWYALINITRLDCMALGGLAAYFIKTKNSLFLQHIYAVPTQGIAWMVFVVSIIFSPFHLYSFLNHEFYAFVAVIIIVNVSTNKNTLITLENRIYRYLGKISYGLYCYHMVLICIFSASLKGVVFPNFLLVKIGLFLGVYLITIGVASISYLFFEQRFINLKHQFTRILSGEFYILNRPKA